jgi:hypothetical protein
MIVPGSPNPGCLADLIVIFHMLKAGSHTGHAVPRSGIELQGPLRPIDSPEGTEELTKSLDFAGSRATGPCIHANRPLPDVLPEAPASHLLGHPEWEQNTPPHWIDYRDARDDEGEQGEEVMGGGRRFWPLVKLWGSLIMLFLTVSLAAYIGPSPSKPGSLTSLRLIAPAKLQATPVIDPAEFVKLWHSDLMRSTHRESVISTASDEVTDRRHAFASDQLLLECNTISQDDGQARVLITTVAKDLSNQRMPQTTIVKLTRDDAGWSIEGVE